MQNGGPIALQGPRTLLLSGAETSWRVLSGFVTLFAAQVRDGLPDGPRRHLGDFGKDGILFGFPSPATVGGRGIFAIAPDQAELELCDRGQTLAWFASNRGEAAPKLDAWLKTLMIFDLGAGPSAPVQSEGAVTKLETGQAWKAKGGVRWARVAGGTVRWMGRAEVAVGEGSGWLPLLPGMWLEAAAPVEVCAQETRAFAELDPLLQGLWSFHTLMLLGLDEADLRDGRIGLERMQARRQFTSRYMASSLNALASVTAGELEQDFTGAGSPLWAAAKAVARASGITLRPAMTSRMTGPGDVAAIARASRVRVRKVVLRDKWWKREAGPMLAFRRDAGQAVALLPVAAGRYELHDPEQDSRVSVGSRVADTLSYEAFVFVRPFEERVVKTLDVLKLALEPYRREILWLFFAGLTTAFLGMLTPQALGIMVDHAIPNADRNMALDLGMGLAAAAVSVWLLRIAEDVAFMRMELGAEYALQLALWDRLLRIRLPFFRKYTSGDLQTRASAVSAIRSQLSGATLRSLFTSALALLFAAQMFYYSADLSWLALGVAFVAVSATFVGGVLIQRTQRRVLDLHGKVAGLTLQLLGGISKLRVACAEERAYAFWAREFSRKEREGYASWRIQNVIGTLNGVIAPVGTILLYACVAALLAPGRTAALSTGDFLAFHAAYGGFIWGVAGLGNIATSLLEIPGLWSRAKPLLEAPLEVTSERAHPGQLSGKIAVENIVFRYREGGLLVMNGLSMNVQAGEFVALVGPSGAGKSTLFRILLGIDTPESGSVYYDGQDLSGIDVTAVRRQIGVVLQNAQILSGTLLENISPGSQIREEQGLEAARLAGMAEDVEKMPMGLLTLVNEGASNLSGGQRQRLLLARALVHKPRILLLDEATSSLDNRTQSIVSTNLAHLKVTRLVIAHRLSTIRNADRILVMDRGRIVQEGTFDTLSRQPGLFTQLANRQWT